MTRKGVFPIVATLAVVGVVLAVFSQTVMRDSNISTNTMTTEQAYADLSGKMKRIGVQEVSVNPQQLDVSEFLDAKDELPDIDSSYPFVVEGNGDVNIEIFSSGEKAAESGKKMAALAAMYASERGYSFIPVANDDLPTYLAKQQQKGCVVFDGAENEREIENTRRELRIPLRHCRLEGA